jgi:hypothetical protein
MWLAAPSVLVFKYKGHTDAAYLAFIDSVYDRTLAQLSSPTHVFIDCEDQTGYDAAFRTGITEWGKRVVPRSTTYCLFVRSRLVAMGVTLAKLLGGSAVQHADVVTDRNAFRSKLEAAIQRSYTDASIQGALQGAC